MSSRNSTARSKTSNPFAGRSTFPHSTLGKSSLIQENERLFRGLWKLPCLCRLQRVDILSREQTPAEFLCMPDNEGMVLLIEPVVRLECSFEAFPQFFIGLSSRNESKAAKDAPRVCIYHKDRNTEGIEKYRISSFGSHSPERKEGIPRRGFLRFSICAFVRRTVKG